MSEAIEKIANYDIHKEAIEAIADIITSDKPSDTYEISIRNAALIDGQMIIDKLHSLGYKSPEELEGYKKVPELKIAEEEKILKALFDIGVFSPSATFEHILIYKESIINKEHKAVAQAQLDSILKQIEEANE